MVPKAEGHKISKIKLHSLLHQHLSFYRTGCKKNIKEEITHLGTSLAYCSAVLKKSAWKRRSLTFIKGFCKKKRVKSSVPSKPEADKNSPDSVDFGWHWLRERLVADYFPGSPLAATDFVARPWWWLLPQRRTLTLRWITMNVSP